ncbi:MAG: hypothetical protein RMJ56_05785 [Gemmataceae bacterium]|nr:hypothetical protein [Gemmata sp.]MDW8197099.1 hypothetical protein [Gemmataceae bacterium]
MTSFLMATVWLATAAAPAYSPPSQPPTTRYYFILFGGQSVPFIPRTAHTFATFVKVTTTDKNDPIVETVTISWLPVDGKVHPWRLRTVEGKNFSLEETLALAARDNVRVSMWGPFEIDAARYESAVVQAKLLASGAVRYRVLDSLGRNRRVSHCVHAVTYADPQLQWLRQPVLRVGEPGTSKLAIKYAESGAFLSPETHDWLLPLLGLDQQPIIRRELGEIVPRQWR